MALATTLTPRCRALTATYFVLYLAASTLDLWTTALAVRGGAHEGNAFATTASAYDPAKAWIITALGAVVLVPLFAFGAANAYRVADVWLRRPIQSFAKVYLFPWSEAVADRGPLHALSIAMAFPVLCVLAAINNACVFLCGLAPIGSLFDTVSMRTSPPVALLVVGGGLMAVLTLVASAVTARILARRS